MFPVLIQSGTHFDSVRPIYLPRPGNFGLSKFQGSSRKIWEKLYCPNRHKFWTRKVIMQSNLCNEKKKKKKNEGWIKKQILKHTISQTLEKQAACWTISLSWTASYEITLFRQFVRLSVGQSVRLSVRPSPSFLKIRLLVFSYTRAWW